MHIIAVGLNHKTAPIELRERLAFSMPRLTDAYSILSKSPFIQEAVILSTCNRVEIYAAADIVEKGILALKEFLSLYHKVRIQDFEPNLYIYLEPESIFHLFDVASGLDSMVIGETQILGQLKQAYFDAFNHSSAGKALESLFQTAFHTAKEMRNSTQISKGPVCVSSVAVKLAQELLGNLSQRKVIFIGAGKMSELAMKYLVSKGVNTVLVSNRTFEKARELAAKFGGQAIRFYELLNFMVEADIVISSTSAPHLILRKRDIVPLIKQRNGKPLFFIDLAVPRDIEFEVREIEGAYLYDIDDLKMITQKNIRLRQKEIDSCKKIIQANVDKFMAGFEYYKKESFFLPALAKNELAENLISQGAREILR